jgi:hypothetical protein
VNIKILFVADEETEYKIYDNIFIDDAKIIESPYDADKSEKCLVSVYGELCSEKISEKQKDFYYYILNLKYVCLEKLSEYLYNDSLGVSAGMLFGGTEKEILTRGTDWCFDLARVAAVILDCIGLTSRFVFVANPYKAYNAHVLLEVYYNDSWGVIDPLYGYIFFDTKPINAKDIIHSAQLKSMNEDYKHMFNQISIAEYNPNDVDNKYIVSKCNEYTYKINTIIQDGTWLLGEDKK